jgi:hypothetical protein
MLLPGLGSRTVIPEHVARQRAGVLAGRHSNEELLEESR